jgi:hypothetical protein
VCAVLIGHNCCTFAVAVFYNGELGQDVVRAVASAGGLMTEQDLAAYQAVRRPELSTVFADFNILVPDAPSGGPALLAALKLLPDINSTASGQGMSTSDLLSLANASESAYSRTLLGMWGNNAEQVLLFAVDCKACMVRTLVCTRCTEGLFIHFRGT